MTSSTWFLGGYDLEMVTIRDLLTDSKDEVRIVDKQLAWGAACSDYADELTAEWKNGRQIVLVELEIDVPLVQRALRDKNPRLVCLDHHNEKAGADAPTPLELAIALLNIDVGTLSTEQRRWLELVSANDRGYLNGMLALSPPASIEEMAAIRQADRTAQGVTTEDDALASKALANKEVLCGGQLTIVRSETARTSTITDQLDERLGGAGFQNLIVVTPSSVNVFATGQIIEKLNNVFGAKNCWSGGNLPESGYWGSNVADPKTVRSTIEDLLT